MIETLTSITCYKCAVEFGLATTYYNVRLRDAGTFYCPNGHAQHFTETREQRLEKELAREKSARIQAESRAVFLHDQLNMSERLGQRAAVRARNAHRKLRAVHHRIKHGVCPFCHRYFTKLHAHMDSKHQRSGRSK